LESCKRGKKKTPKCTADGTL